MDHSAKVETTIHHKVGWMVDADSFILLFAFSTRDIQNRPAKLTPKVIAMNIGYSRKHVGNRCRTLADRGLLEKANRGEYRLSNKGYQLMSGEIDASSL